MAACGPILWHQGVCAQAGASGRQAIFLNCGQILSELEFDILLPHWQCVMVKLWSA